MSLFRATRPPDEPHENGARPADGLAERIQARIDALEATTAELPARSGARAAGEPEPSSNTALTADIADLNAQLELLREQLELAFNEMEGRITAAAERAVAAEARAEQAETQARSAAARAANVLYAVDDLAADLARAATRSNPDDLHRLRGAVDKLRSRLTGD